MNRVLGCKVGRPEDMVHFYVRFKELREWIECGFSLDMGLCACSPRLAAPENINPAM
jgi:hypothetical protein